MSKEVCSEFFLFCLDPELFSKRPGFYKLTQKSFLSITQGLNKIKKNTILQILLSRKHVQNFNKKY